MGSGVRTAIPFLSTIGSTCWSTPSAAGSPSGTFESATGVGVYHEVPGADRDKARRGQVAIMRPDKGGSDHEADPADRGRVDGRRVPALRHVVLFKFKDDAKPEQIQQVETEFKALKGKISEVQGLEWGTNVSPENLAQGFTHCFFVSFADAKGRDAYLTHAAHQDFVKILKPVLDKVLVV